MKKFIINISLFIVLFILGLVFLLGYRIIQTNRISWSLPKEKHILFMGASHILRGINDSVYPQSFNIASSSERYLFTYLKLNKLIEDNPQIDTIFIQFAPTDIWEHTDTKYYSANEMSYFLPIYFPFFHKEEWTLYLNMNWKEVISIILQKLGKNVPVNIHSFGGFSPIDISFDRNQPKYQVPVWTKSGHSINYHYLKKIENICKTKGIKLYFLYMPVFDAKSFYNQDYYYKVYSSIFSNIELLDYSNWNCPDNYRADEHHLNVLGANNFTEFLLIEVRKKTHVSNSKIPASRVSVLR